VTREKLIEWLETKLETSKRELKARQQSAETWQSGDDKSWRAMGCRLSAGRRRLESEKETRIALKIQHDIDAIEELISLVFPY